MSTMLLDQKRYFIELQPEPNTFPRYMETSARREQASLFIKNLRKWLTDQNLYTRVSKLAITALGQVQITCDEDIMSQLRQQREEDIAAIRQCGFYANNLYRCISTQDSV